VATLSAFLRAAPPWAVYGFIKRGSRRTAVELESSLSQDWIHIPHFLVAASGGRAWESEYVPDAFGIQLLGPGHMDRIPAGPDWRPLQIGPDAVVLEHTDPEAWFDGTLVPFGGYPISIHSESEPVPDVVARARQDFARILLTDDIVWGR
jgi:hypothetical protein